MTTDISEALKQRLSAFKYQRGASHFFTGETLFRPDWLSGYHLRTVRIIYYYHTYLGDDVMTSLIIEASQSSSDQEGIEYERFYEGSCPTFEDFETIIRLLKFEI